MARYHLDKNVERAILTKLAAKMSVHVSAFNVNGELSIQAAGAYVVGARRAASGFTKSIALGHIMQHLGEKLPPCEIAKLRGRGPSSSKPKQKPQLKSNSKQQYPEHIRTRIYPEIAVFFGSPNFQKRVSQWLKANLQPSEMRYHGALVASFSGSNGLIAAKQTKAKGFYESHAWKTLRYAALKQSGGKCCCCGSAQGPLHVDHIIPRSKDASKELDLSNLQVLCGDCNEGKGNWDQTDWRKS
jgi:hypothetical protein